MVSKCMMGHPRSPERSSLIKHLRAFESLLGEDYEPGDSICLGEDPRLPAGMVAVSAGPDSGDLFRARGWRRDGAA